MPVGATAAAIAGGASLLSSFLGSRQSRINTRDTIAARKELAQYQFEKNRQMWNLMKKYNSPKAQMARFKEAGLNPNLIYGQGTPGNVQSYPKYQAPQVSYMGREAMDFGKPIAEGISTYTDIGMYGAQKDLTTAQADKAIEQKYLIQQQKLLTQSKEDLNRQEQQRMSYILGEITLRGKEYAEAAVDKFINSSKKVTLEKIYQSLKNEYQGEVNKWAKRGMSLNDNIQWRALVQIINKIGQKIGFSTDWLQVDEILNQQN